MIAVVKKILIYVDIHHQVLLESEINLVIGL